MAAAPATTTRMRCDRGGPGDVRWAAAPEAVDVWRPWRPCRPVLGLSYVRYCTLHHMQRRRAPRAVHYQPCVRSFKLHADEGRPVLGLDGTAKHVARLQIPAPLPIPFPLQITIVNTNNTITMTITITITNTFKYHYHAMPCHAMLRHSMTQHPSYAEPTPHTVVDFSVSVGARCDSRRVFDP